MYKPNILALQVRRRASIILVAGTVLLGTLVAAGCGTQGTGSPVDSPAAQNNNPPAQSTGTVMQVPTILTAATQPVSLSPTASVGNGGANATTTGTVLPSEGTLVPVASATGVSSGAATAAATGTAVSTATPEDTATPTVTGTPPTSTPRPLPTGTPQDPKAILNLYEFFGSSNTLVRRDFVQLDGKGVDEAVYTITGPDPVITTENRSAVEVLMYDDTYREWNVQWHSDPMTGTASPLLSAAQSQIGGLNNGDLLRTGQPIFMLRTTTQDGRAHLYLWKWDAAQKTATMLRMLPVGGGPERDAAFDADLDINMADLNNDGVYSVVADNVAGVLVWKWDGQKFVPEVKR